jgi:predicted membrane metal-binding protein
MVNDVWKRIGIILSALRLLVAGYCQVCVLFYSEGVPRSEYLWTQSLALLAYILFGIGPVLAFILLMKKRYGPIGYRALTVLALFAASPLWLLLFGHILLLLLLFLVVWLLLNRKRDTCNMVNTTRGSA